ncbi:MAG: hypothetical protein ACLT2Z_03985 [Eubacterium sp.]
MSFDSMQLKENNDNSAYEEVVVRIKDAGGIDTASLKYKWVEEGEAVPNVENYDTIDVNDVKTVTKSGDKVTECLATVRQKMLRLIVFIRRDYMFGHRTLAIMGLQVENLRMLTLIWNFLL